jgi:hypothetical protein
MIVPFSAAQDGSDRRNIRLSKLSDTVDRERAEQYLNQIEKEIEKLISEFPQLSSWMLNREGKTRSEAGKERTPTSLTYAHGLRESKSSVYLDQYGTEGFYLNVRVVSKRYFSRLSGASVESVVFGWSVADGCVVAGVMSANPKVPELEKKIADIIKRGLSRKRCY